MAPKQEREAIWKVALFEKNEAYLMDETHSKDLTRFLVSVYGQHYLTTNAYHVHYLRVWGMHLIDSTDTVFHRHPLVRLLWTLPPNPHPYHTFYFDTHRRVPSAGVGDSSLDIESIGSYGPSFTKVVQRISPYMSGMGACEGLGELLVELWSALVANEFMQVKDCVERGVLGYRRYAVEVCDVAFVHIPASSRRDIVWFLWKFALICVEKSRCAAPVRDYIMDLLTLFGYQYQKKERMHRMNYLLFAFYALVGGEEMVFAQEEPDQETHPLPPIHKPRPRPSKTHTHALLSSVPVTTQQRHSDDEEESEEGPWEEKRTDLEDHWDLFYSAPEVDSAARSIVATRRHEGREDTSSLRTISSRP